MTLSTGPSLASSLTRCISATLLILRVIPFLDGDELRIDGVLPDTQRGRDAATNIREHVYTGLSLEFKAEREHRRGGVRAIQRAWVPRAALVDSPAYTDSLVEVRAKDYAG